MFRRLFRGRSDVYPTRWESKTSGKSGYSPACANEWRAGVCEKPSTKCSDCGHRSLIPLSDEIIYKHLSGEHTLGVYPLLTDDTTHFLAVDFDDADWREDILRASGGMHPLDVTFIDEEDHEQPWKRPPALHSKIIGAMPESASVTLANFVYFE